MRASGPLHPLRDDGTDVDATFEVVDLSVFEIVFHHKARGRDDPRAENIDYHEGLEILLRRLATLKARILSIEVDSSVARERPPSERELPLDYPIALHPDEDFKERRREITRAQKGVARSSKAKKAGGNDQKRIRMTVSVESPLSDYDTLCERLVGDQDQVAARVEAVGQVAGQVRGRTSFGGTGLAQLIQAGALPATGELVARYKQSEYRATWSGDGSISLDGRTYAAPSAAAVAITQNPVNGWRFWSVERDGERRLLADIRSSALDDAP